MTASEPRDLVAAAMAGDASAFARLAASHRRELHVHCARMLSWSDDAEDAVQETFLRAWRSRALLSDPARLRAWLYRIATNVCVDLIRHRSRTATGVHEPGDVARRASRTDGLPEEVEAAEQPDAVVVGRETIELFFVTALDALPPRQRAALIVRDVLGWPASDTAVLLQTSVAAANSTVQRARAAMQHHLPAQRSEWRARPMTGAQGSVVQRFIDAHERHDDAAVIEIATAGIRASCPSAPCAR